MSEPNVEAVYPLSPMQEGILFHTLYAEESRVYFEQLGITYQGALDAVCFRRAWQRMVDRHAILRTLFVWERQKKPLQVVRRRAELDWSEEDWRGRTAVEQEQALEAFLAADRDRGFDITKAPPLRLSLIRTAEETWQLVWSFHHILLDGWSMAVLGREVLACYEAFVRGAEPELPPVRPYREYIRWLQQQSSAKSEAFWRRSLDGFTTPSRRKLSGNTSGVGGFREARLELPEAQGTALRALARQHRLTPSTFFQAIWALVLSRHVGEPDVVFGAAFSGRPPELVGVESMVGLFIATLPVRVQVTSEDTFLGWMKGLQDAQFELQQHQHASLVDIQSWSQVPRGVPLFDSLLVYENYPIDPASREWARGISVTGFRYWAHTNYSLHLRVVPSTPFHLSLTYDADHFDDLTAGSVLDQVQALVAQVLARPESRVDELSLVTPQSRAVLPDIAAPLDAEDIPPVTAEFEAWARRSPSQAALTQGDRILGYGELLDRARTVAQALLAGGLAPGEVVAIDARPCFGLIASLLGTFFARGVALMADDGLPTERRQLMCREANARHLVRFGGGEPALEADVWVGAGFRSVVTVDPASASVLETGHAGAATELRGPHVEDTAYVFFTSGTTGVPKGVLGTHLGLSHFVRWQRTRFEVGPGDRCSQLTGLSFDVVLREIFLPLTSGATLCLPDETGDLGAESVLPWLEREGITVLHTVPTLARTWVPDLPRGVWLGSLRLVFFAGEPLEGRLVRQWRETLATSARIVNLYGPTETTLAKCFYEVPADPGEEVQPVGRPLPQSQALVLASGARPCGVGEWGEIVIRTPYRTRGYVNAPEDNRRRFRPNPARVHDADDLVYHTGDRGRFRADGVLEISGRLDDQLKIRGARVEPDEVAAILSQHGGVRQAAVLGREIGGALGLVAYVVPAPASTPETAELKSFLKARLPEHMVPSAFVFLEALPITANGKLDRRRLPDPGLAAPPPATSPVAPRAPIEEELAGIWREVLGAPSVGAHDDFFELGGHSLLATQVISRVRSAFGTELSVRSLYEFPTIAGLATVLEAGLRGPRAVPLPPLVRVTGAELIPLSFAQQRLWFLEQMVPGTSAYNVPWVVRLDGALDRSALEGALAEIVRRHEVLRSTVDMTTGTALQRIHPPGPFALATIDLRDRPGDRRDEEALTLAYEEAARPFDLARGPLFRATLLQLGDQQHVLIVTMHHIVSDAWSLGVLAREMGTLYTAYVDGRPSPLGDLAVQYPDFAQWQRSWLQGEALSSQLSYWKERLAGPLPVLDLPTDHPRPPVPAFVGAHHALQLPPALAEEIHALSRRERATVFMTLLTAFGAVLHRYTGQDDILVGIPVAGRSLEETEGLIGFFVNTLVIRMDVSGRPSFRSLLGRVREAALGAYAHPDLPFERLVDELQLERELSRNPIFQTMVTLQNAPPASLRLPGLSASPVPVPRRNARFDLTLFLVESAEGLLCVFEYSAELFEASTIERMASHFRLLLEGAVSRPERQVGDLPLLPEAEERQVVVEWNATDREYARDQTIGERFTAQALRSPESTAVSFEGDALSYRELDERSNRLARHLRGLGVRFEARVGVSLERCLELPVALLGVIKAGGAYVPLDPGYPADRLSFMVADSQVKVLLTRESLLGALPSTEARVVCLDRDWAEVARESAAPLASGATAETLAYVTYTSGSTGIPKGVEVLHRGVLRLLFGVDYADLGPEEVFLQLAPVSFDASTLEVWGPLLHGGRCVLFPERVPTARELGEVIEREGVTTTWLTASLYNAMLDEAPEALRALKQLLIGGEALSASHVRRGLELLPRTRIINGYGPTEGTTFTCCYPIPRDLGEEVVSIPIGRPIANTRVYVLDEALRPVPIGVSGELFIGGDGLARGYLGQPALTAEKFVPDPFAVEPGGRLYRTGDLVRYLEDGNVEFLGRKDHQVKVRGFRIELGEIESVLGAHPAVKDAVVIVREDHPGDRRLVAYVVGRNGQALETGDLRSHLKERVPRYMVPSVFVSLESLPLSPNGKVDRRALPAPEGMVVSGEAYEGPRTRTEEVLARIWSEVLRVPVVGIRDNFFELGGDSILSLQVVARASEAGLRLSIKDVFQHQTVLDLASVAGTTPAAEAEQGLVTGEVPLTPVQRWFFEHQEEEPHHFNQAVLLDVRSPVAPEVLERALRELESHHDALRMRFVEGTRGWEQQGVAPSASVPLRCVDLGSLAESEQGNATDRIVEETQRSLDLDRGPVWRAVLFGAGEGRPQRLLLVVHHLVVDGVSWRVLLEDLQGACERLGRGEGVTLPRKTTSFKRWSERLLEHARGGGGDAERDYWRGVVGAGSVRLPLDHAGPDGRNTVATTRTVSVVLAEDETQALLREVPAAYRTQIGDVLLTAVLEAFSQWTGGDELLLDLEGHGRIGLFPDIDSSRTVGWFTTIYPVRLRRPAGGLADALRAVKEQLRTVPNHGIGFGVLRYLCGEDLRVGAEVCFNYLGQFDQVFGGGGLFAAAGEEAGPARSERARRAYLIDIRGLISGGRLRLDWAYSEAVHERATVEAVARTFLDSLRALIQHCRSGAWGYTPSDFPLAQLDQVRLDRVIAGRREVDDIYPLSPMQEGMLFHSLMSPGGGLYVEQGKFELEGRLEAPALRGAWERVVARHGVLRTRFAWEGLERPLQVVERAAFLPWEEEDWSRLAPSEQERRFEELLKADRERGFDLGRAPLTRLRLVRLATDRHRLLWTFHHALLEGWSVALVLKELLGLYRFETEGDAVHLGEARPYHEYIAWLGRQDLEAAERYWRRELAGFRTPTPLGIDRALRERDEERGGAGERVFALPEVATDALKSLGRRHGLTLSTLAQGAWAVLLSRYSGERDVLFGVTVSGRPPSLRGVEGMVGLFINTLPLRVRVPDEQVALKWLKDLQSRQAEQRQWDYSPLAEVQRWSEVEPGRALFESLLVFENYPVDPSLGDVAREPRLSSLGIRETTNYPLVVVVSSGSRLQFRLTYDRARFDEDSISRLEGHLTRLLEGLSSGAESPLEDLPLLAEPEQSRVLHEWNATGRAYPERAIGAIFREQAERSPEAEAVSFDGQVLSYRELESRSNRLARHLRGLGVGPEVRVGVCLERSLDLPVALLGIVKAGGAYVPLDPSYPAERLSFMLTDSRVAVLVTQERLLQGLPAHDAWVVCVDRDRSEVSGQSAKPFDSGATVENLAYVTYTSGSTGIPKGVEVRHRGVLRLVFGMEYARFGPEEVFLQLAPVSFDASTLEVWGALLHGGKCVVYPERVATPRDLGEVLSRERVTTLWLTASLYNAVLDEYPEGLRGLKQLLIGGEALSVRHVRRGLSALPQTRIINGYGPTENTTFTCCYPIPRDLPEGVASIPIGRPISNTRVYVLDGGMRPVPIGVSGELFIGGDGLARGYLGRPELTAERFVPDPFAAEPGGRLYRTGDLVRYRADGNVEFLGRRDHQVKVRGFRIELGEVESVLVLHPAVKAAVVLAREDHPGEKRLVAYVTPRDGQVLETGDLRRYLKGKLPEYMVPSAFVTLASLPLSPNGKVDRSALPVPESRAQKDQAVVPPRNDLESTIAAIWREVLHLDEVGVHDNFFDLGGHSLSLLRVHGKLRESVKHADVKIVDLFQYPTISALGAHLSPAKSPRADVVSPIPRTPRGEEARGVDEGVAIIGMAGRFPGARDIEEFWRNLRDGVESIAFFSAEELEAEGLAPELCRDPRLIKARGMLDGADLFDAAFFGYNPREAETMDPQQRVFLETAWTALEGAGYDSETYPGRIGVYAGTSANAYLLHVTSDADRIASAGGFAALLGTDKDFLTTRTSYKMNLRGPSVTVQTACSTSLVAVHLACRSLFLGECDIALAGGVSVAVPLKGGQLYQEEGVRSPDGHCRAFDRKAQGAVGGSGVGVVVLKRLRDAVADRDTIAAVIRGSAINNDGAVKVGYTAPSVEGQAAVIVMAHAAAGVEPETIGYVEAHGTGTALGDPIEIEALRQAFGDRQRSGSCAIGSVKTNVGHLDAAAGVTGLIKTVLALEHRQIPPSLHFEEPNPNLELDGSPFRVNARLSEWTADQGPRRAGVSAFGIGGTNAHVVVEEAPAREVAVPSARPWHLLVLSARTPTALEQATRNLATHLEQHAGLDLADVAHTLRVGRRAFRYRRAVVCRDLAHATRALRSREADRLLDAQLERRGLGVAFLFPGQGAQYPNMGRGLYESEEAFRSEVDRCAERLRGDLGFDLREVLYPAEGKEAAANRRLDETAVAQPALFVVEIALARLWLSWGIRPVAMLGHSVGEYVAACLAGVFSLEDALSLVAARGRLMQGLPTGSMLAVALPEQEVRPLLDGTVSLAATNAPSQCVVSGLRESVERIEAQLGARGVESHRLRTSHAFHSPMMEPVLSAFRERVAAVARHAPQIPFVSNHTGTWITEEQAVDAGYWARQVRDTVRFSDGITELVRDDRRLLLEVGPGQTLSSLARQHALSSGAPAVAVASARHPRESRPDAEVLLGALGALWVAGVDVDWTVFNSMERRRRVPLPTYPFERQRYWIDLRPASPPAALPAVAPSGKRRDIADWFYRPTWRSSASLAEPREPAEERSGWLVFADETGLGEHLAERLESRGHPVVTVWPGPRFERRGSAEYSIRPGEAADYEALLRAVAADGGAFDRIAHLWGVTPRGVPTPTLSRSQDLGFYSLIFLCQALGSRSVAAEVGIVVVTSGMQEVSGEGLACPEKATVLGPCHVIPQEYPKLECRSVDILTPGSGVWPEAAIDGLFAECYERQGEPVVAHRGSERWVQTFVPVRLEGREERPGRLRKRGTYLITGGLGGIGLEIAGFLADSVQARLVLLGRTGLPPRADWSAWVEREAGDTSRRILKVQGLEARGAEVLVLQADVSDLQQMENAFAEAEAQFGRIDGVIHAAGVAPGGVIQLKTREMAQRVLAPKVEGTLVLERILEDRPADFVVLCSSLASVMGVPGQADYCAANAFQDAFARRSAAGGGPHVLALNWDTWRETGMAVENAARRDVPEQGMARPATDDGILSAEGTEAFARALREPVPQLLVCTIELSARRARVHDLGEVLRVAGREALARHRRPELAGAYVAPGDELEHAVAEIWQDLLGFEQVGIHDNFFDLGGHSLLAMQIVNRLRQEFQVAIKLQTLFDAPTVGELARAIVANEPQPGRVREIARLARSVATLSDEDVERMLQDEGTPEGYAR